ncbi:MAG: hypothetical protein JXX28_13610 [Deltaproteobacteria bacterium]|nr:hypothetical protein [Deltaproteobacteria bacterium]
MRALAFALAALPLTLSACGTEAADPGAFAEILPDQRVMIDLPVDYAGAAREREWSQLYLHTAMATENVNGLIGSVLTLVDTVTALPPSWSDEEDNTAVWGPFTDPLNPAETVLWVHYDEPTDVYTWVFGQRPKNMGEVEWIQVVAGQVNEGATEEASDGWFAIDFDKLHELDPTHTATGRFVTEYDVAQDQVSAQAIFDDFADGDGPTDAVYRYEQVVGGEGAMQLMQTVDIHGDQSLDELLAIHSRWLNSGEGRGDAWVTGGDLGDAVGTLSECWGPVFDVVYSLNNWDESPEQGDVGECAFAEAEFVSGE